MPARQALGPFEQIGYGPLSYAKAFCQGFLGAADFDGFGDVRIHGSDR
jgi:hypothetical protein